MTAPIQSTFKKSTYRELEEFMKEWGFEKKSQAIQFLLNIHFFVKHTGNLITYLQINDLDEDIDLKDFTRREVIRILAAFRKRDPRKTKTSSDRTEIRVCFQCGKERDDSAVHCPSCGSKNYWQKEDIQ